MGRFEFNSLFNFFFIRNEKKKCVHVIRLGCGLTTSRFYQRERTHKKIEIDFNFEHQILKILFAHTFSAQQCWIIIYQTERTKKNLKQRKTSFPHLTAYVKAYWFHLIKKWILLFFFFCWRLVFGSNFQKWKWWDATMTVWQRESVCVGYAFRIQLNEQFHLFWFECLNWEALMFLKYKSNRSIH